MEAKAGGGELTQEIVNGVLKENALKAAQNGGNGVVNGNGNKRKASKVEGRGTPSSKKSKSSPEEDGGEGDED